MAGRDTRASWNVVPAEVRARWEETWDLLELPAPDSLLAELAARYEEPRRHYHVLGHVTDCLEKARWSREIQERPGEVELALWFHDAVYWPWRLDNESRSAELARDEVSRVGASPETADRVRRHVLDTKAHEPSSSDGAVVVDADLSILGAAPARFAGFQEAIRKEYAWVPAPVYRWLRRKALRRYLDRERIYATSLFRMRFEEAARTNLRTAVRELGGRV